MAAQYPTSCYTAWIYNNSIRNLTVGDPRSTAASVKNNKFLSANSVWDPETKGIHKSLWGPEYAKWENKKSLEIIKSCPRFPGKNKLIIRVAINNIELGNEQKGIEMLKILIRDSNSREAIWAYQFLKEWEKQKTKL